MSITVIIQALIVAAVTAIATAIVTSLVSRKVLESRMTDVMHRLERIEHYLNGLLKKP